MNSGVKSNSNGFGCEILTSFISFLFLKSYLLSQILASLVQNSKPPSSTTSTIQFTRKKSKQSTKNPKSVLFLTRPAAPTKPHLFFVRCYPTIAPRPPPSCLHVQAEFHQNQSRLSPIRTHRKM